MSNPQTSIGTALGPYSLIRQLGQGGMGVVWLAYDAMLARHVAIKEVKASGPGQNTMIRRLLREARAAARLSHPNVVTIHQVASESGPNGQRTYIAMEYVDGGSMADFLRDHGPLPWREAALVMRGAACGLAAAHEAGLIHRDIKPANLMRTKRGTVKLVDFGLARGHFTDPELSTPGAFLGSPSYAAPEQALPLPGKRVDERADIYSLASTFFALLTGRPPFVDDDAVMVLRQHQEEPFPDPRLLAQNAGIPDGVCRLLLQASAKSPAARHQSAEEFLAALEAVLASPEQSHTFEAPWPACAATAVADEKLPPAVQHWRTLYRDHLKAGRPSEALDAYRRALAAYLREKPPAGFAGRFL